MQHLVIDGTDVDVADGLTILQAALQVGIEIPTRCTDPRLEPVGACRMCVVAVDDGLNPVAACTTAVVDGMTVETTTPLIEAVRAELELMVARPAAGSIPELIDDSHPLIHVDMSQCIECWRCVRICDEVEGRSVWHVESRGASSRIVADSGTTLLESSCVACGACVDACPTDALVDKSLVSAAQPTDWTRTTCPYCGVGCELMLGTRDNEVIAVRPAIDAPVNRGHACVKGRYGFGFTSAPDRMSKPMIRDADGWREVTWDAAFSEVASRLRDISESHGPDAIGVLASARATNEDNYLWQKFARAVLRTNNVDSCARVCHAPSAVGLKTVFGTGAATSSFDDIERAGTIMLCGTNTTENHPVVGVRILQAARRGANLIVIDPRRTELAAAATIHLRPRPGTTVALLASMASAIVDEGLVDAAFIDTRVEGFDEYRRACRAWSPEKLADVCGVEADDIRAAARLYATATPSISFHGLGLTEHHQGTDGVICIANLALLTGNLGRPGSGVNPLRGQNNVQGAAHMGCEPSNLPGYVPIAAGVERISALWGVEVPLGRGLDAMEMIDAAGAGELHGLIAAGWDIASTQADMNTTRRGLSQLQCLVVVDLFLNETAREFANIFLPAAAAFEKDGTFMNSERRVQRVRRAVNAPGVARADWQIVQGLAHAFGADEYFAYRDSREIWDEIREAWAPGAGITNERLDAPGGVQWPCPSTGHPGTTLLHVDNFPGIGARAQLRAIEFVASPEQRDDIVPMWLVTGRSLYQFNAGTMTRRSLVHQCRPTDTLEIHPHDAARFGILNGQSVEINSRHGRAILPVEITERVEVGVLFCTFNDPTTEVNRVTSPYRDRQTHAPEYKLTAVAISPLKEERRPNGSVRRPTAKLPA